ncbi:MAG: HAD-IA family hydrolase [Lachnospiraceae bacterium]
MGTILDYIVWRGDLTMKERPFNEVDNLILSELVYFDFDKVMEEETAITIEEAYRWYQLQEYPENYSINDPVPILKACAESRRFSDIQISDFISIIDQELQIQFAAAVFHMDDNMNYVAFRGTDNTIVGWREDFNFSFMEETGAQAEALQYLNLVLEQYQAYTIVGGHSKGGNLAIYAAAFCDELLKNRILWVYSNDGPGFNRYIAEQLKELDILSKVQQVMPEGSIVGIIFSNQTQKKIIRSYGNNGAEQHDPYTWMVERDHFVIADSQSSSSMILDETLRRWMEMVEPEQRKVVVSCIFDAIDASGATTLPELNENKWISYNAILKAASMSDPEVKNTVLDSFRKLAMVGKDVIWDETQKKFEPLKQKAIDPLKKIDMEPLKQKAITPLKQISLEHIKQKTVEPLKQLTRESWPWKHEKHDEDEELSCESAVVEMDLAINNNEFSCADGEKKAENPCHAVIFDMDGVIFDSEKLVVECWKEVADRHGIAGVEAVCRECFGTNREVSRQKFKAYYGQDFPYDEYKKEMSDLFFSRSSGGRLPMKPGVVELLTALRQNGIMTAIASSTRRAIVYEEIGEAGLLDLFDQILCGDMVERSKPDPEIFLKACQLLGVRPEESYVIEDSYNGIRAAYAGGMHPIMVPDQLEPDEEMAEKAEIICRDLFAVIEYLNLK